MGQDSWYSDPSSEFGSCRVEWQATSSTWEMTRLTVWGMGPADAVEMGAQWPIPFLDHLPENDMYSQVDAPNCGLSIFSILLELNQSASEKCKFYLHTWAALKAHCHVSILVPQLFSAQPLARTCRTHGIQAFPCLPSAAPRGSEA